MTAPRRVAAAFSRSDLARAERELLRDGRWANARVEKVTLDGVAWTFKDFSSRPFFVRNTIGRFLSRREWLALSRLSGIDGVPGQAFRVDGHAVAAHYLSGTVLAKLPGEQFGTAFLESYEALLAAVHARGIGRATWRADPQERNGLAQSSCGGVAPVSGHRSRLQGEPSARFPCLGGSTRDSPLC